MSNVLHFLTKDEIEKLFDKDSQIIIEYLLKKVLFSQPELLPGDSNSNIQMTKEFLEQWTAQALGWKTIGAGNYPIDVYSEKLKMGADVKFMSAKVDNSGKFKNSLSNESSLAQNFADTGNNLDSLFKNEVKEEILSGWIDNLIEKSLKPKREYPIDHIYYFIFLRGGDSISLAIAKIDSNNISNIKITRFSGRNGDNKSAFISGYIDDKYGEVKIYKSKKRMELRCYAKNLEDDGLTIKWDFSSFLKMLEPVVLKDLVKNKDNFNEYIERKSREFFDIKKDS